MKVERIRDQLRQDLDRLRAPEGYLYAGDPRYHTLFGRDSLIAAWQMLELDPSIARATLDILASYQGQTVNVSREEEPGKILHEHRFDAESRRELPHWGFPYYGSVDSTPLFVHLAGLYIRCTGDQAFSRRIWPHMKAAYIWIAGSEDAGRGYLRYERKNPRGLFHQGWKDGSEDHLRIRPPVAIVEAQGYAFAAYRAFAETARRVKQTRLADEASARAEALRRRFARDFWMAEESFALGIDGFGMRRDVATSNPGHLLFTGILSPDRAMKTVARLFKPDLWTGFGIRTHSSAAPDFDPYGYHTGTVWPHDNWVIAEGLRLAGRNSEADRIADALINAYSELGKIPELYGVSNGRIVDLAASTEGGVSANPLQAWASAGLLSLIANR